MRKPFDAPDLYYHIELYDEDYLVDEPIGHTIVPLWEVLQIKGCKLMRMRPVIVGNRVSYGRDKN